MTADQLAVVLVEIAEIERREGFEGPKITGYISSVAAMQDMMVRGGGEFMPLVVEDAIIGEIWRAVKSHLDPENYLKDWMIDIEDGGDGGFVVMIRDRVGRLISEGQGPLALAAAKAWLAAIQEIRK